MIGFKHDGRAMSVSHYKELRVYDWCVELRRNVFELSRAWPKEERYALTDQARRSSRAIGANIAEAWAKRRYERHFVSKLTDALAEAEETTVWLDVAEECGYLDATMHYDLEQLCHRICGGLVKMMHEPGKWCAGTTVREEIAPYKYDS